jgi:peptide/nickel transport system permease protein
VSLPSTTRRGPFGRLADTGARWIDSDFVQDFRGSPVALMSLAILVVYVTVASFPSVFAPHPVFNLSTLDFADAFRPPAWLEGGDWRFIFGADDQGRDMLSAIIYGLRVSLFVSFSAVALSVVIGVTLGLIAGFYGGWIDGLIMRIADIQLTFPAMLVAVLFDGLLRAGLGESFHHQHAVWIIIVAIALSGWVQYARTVRGSTLIVSRHNYVLAARMMGQSVGYILFRHILPNVATPVFVVATIQLAIAIILEATLSFVGIGIPPTQPSLGTLIRVGNAYLLSGEWWLAMFPGFALLILVLAVNLLGDFLRDALNPRLKQ